MSDKMREALARLRREASRIERDQHKYAELAYSPTADVLESIADDIDSALAEQPAQGEAVAWRFSPYPAAPKFRVLTEDPDAAQFARDCGVAVTELFTAPPAPKEANRG